MNFCSKLIALAIVFLFAGNLSAQDITLNVQDDVWNYPFNFAPGTRTNGALFGAELSAGPQSFDYHDGIILSLFTPDGSTPEYTTGLEASDYEFDSAVVTFNHSSSDAISEPAYIWEIGVTDGAAYFGTTPTLSLNIHGVGSSSVDLATWTESNPFVGLAGAPTGQERDPFALNIDESATPQNVTNEFLPTSWATSVATPGYTPGVANVNPFPVEFTLDTSNPRVKTYLQEGLASGRLFFAVISNAAATMGGSGAALPRLELNGGGGPGTNPNAATVTFTNFQTSTSVNDWMMFQ